MSFEKLSNYAKQLRDEQKKDYVAKLAILGGTDPYEVDIKTFTLSLDSVPKVASEAITDFLIFRVSPHTQREIRAYKSLDSFAQFACGWIEQIKAKEINNYICVIGKVRLTFF